jgi:acyl-coenzyme A synthetase/AMP-(fatty) acid ligase
VDAGSCAAGALDRDPGLDIAPEAMALVFYTSGSTGEPKGVIQTHRNLLQTARLYANGVELRPSDRVFCPMPLAYAGGVWGLLASLMSGAAFCRGSAEAQTDVAGQLIRQEITVAQLMVSMLRNLLLSASGRERFPTLREVFTGGEVLYGADVERFRAVCPADCGLLYDLGSTEAGIITLYRILPSLAPSDPVSAMAAGQAMPAGYAADDVEVLLLDDDLAPVPDGEVGQIAVRSDFVSPGYWRDPDRTRARFVVRPVDAGRHIYLTGDLGRRLPDGCLVHLGRMDLQTKIRGHRVAPEEIERALREIPAISDAAVAAWTDARGDTHLVAHIASDADARPTVTQVRRQLARSLPAHMVPSRFVFVGALPLLPTGKLDRSALLPPRDVRPPLDVPFVAPRTPLEVLLAGMWAELLAVDRVGVLDGFLDLGGNSLLAARLVAGLVDRLGVDISVREVFEAPDLAGLALRVLELAAAKAAASEG